MEGSLKTGNRLSVAFCHRFDPAVVEVPYEPGQSFPARRFFGEKSKPTPWTRPLTRYRRATIILSTPGG